MAATRYEGFVHETAVASSANLGVPSSSGSWPLAQRHCHSITKYTGRVDHRSWRGSAVLLDQVGSGRYTDDEKNDR